MSNLLEARRDSLYSPPPPGVSTDATQIESAIEAAWVSWQQTLTSRRGRTLAEEFGQLSAEWKEATAYESSAVRIAMHPSYQRIIGMGKAALPLILEDLQRTNAPWFWALGAITGEDPVAVDDRGYIYKMTNAWIKWGTRLGLI